MNCPSCKDKELLPARSREGFKEVDALKCSYCSKMFKMDQSNHLRPLDAPAATHTAALISAGLNPESEKGEEKIEPKPPVVIKDKIDDEDKVEIFRRLTMGEKPVDIAAVIGCKPQAVNNYKFTHKNEILKATKALVKSEDVDHKEKKPATVWSVSRRGSVMSRVARLSRGQIKAQSTRPILVEYKDMLYYDLKTEQTRARNIKKTIEVVDDALNALDILEQGRKDIVDKIIKAVK